MSSSLGVSAHLEGGELKVKLMGPFDQPSAEELIKCLRENRKGMRMAVIETSGLSYVDPIGKRFFRSSLYELKDLCYYLVFNGHYAQEIAPSWTAAF